MGYRTFSSAEYADLNTQHNIMVLVGNGFDIQVTQHYEGRFSPRYPAFFHYLASRDFDSSNLLFQQMAAAQAAGLENWSDIEAAISFLISSQGSQHSDTEIHKATLAIQSAFSEYLELVAPPDLLVRLGKDSAENRLAMTSMSKFIGYCSSVVHL